MSRGSYSGLLAGLQAQNQVIWSWSFGVAYFRSIYHSCSQCPLSCSAAAWARCVPLMPACGCPSAVHPLCPTSITMRAQSSDSPGSSRELGKPVSCVESLCAPCKYGSHIRLKGHLPLRSCAAHSLDFCELCLDLLEPIKLC